MEWISVKERLPQPIERSWTKNKSIKVLAAWGLSESNMAEMEYVEETVRGKLVNRFKWNGKISPWNVTHWMPLPEPPKE